MPSPQPYTTTDTATSTAPVNQPLGLITAVDGELHVPLQLRNRTGSPTRESRITDKGQSGCSLAPGLRVRNSLGIQPCRSPRKVCTAVRSRVEIPMIFGIVHASV